MINAAIEKDNAWVRVPFRSVGKELSVCMSENDNVIINVFAGGKEISHMVCIEPSKEGNGFDVSVFEDSLDAEIRVPPAPSKPLALVSNVCGCGTAE